MNKVITDTDIHLHNYRIAFDGMRAYHTSEIEHKKDSIAILNNILIPIVTTYAGIFYFITESNLMALPSCQSFLETFIKLVGLLFSVLIIVLTYVSNTKINKDHRNYEKYRAECMLERRHLQIDAFIKGENAEGKIYWSNYADINDENENRKNSGYSTTKKILNIYTIILILIIIFLTCFSLKVTSIRQNAKPESTGKTVQATEKKELEKQTQTVTVKMIE